MVSLAKASVLPNDSLPVGIKSTCSWWLGLEVEPGPIPTYTVQLWKHTFESTMTTQIKIPSSQSQPHVACRTLKVCIEGQNSVQMSLLSRRLDGV
jgi:hypothetical protein